MAPTTTKHAFKAWVLRQNKPSIRVDHRCGGEGGHCRDQIIACDAHAAGSRQEIIDKDRSKCLAARGFGRGACQERMGEQFLHQPLVDTAATSPLTVSIEGFPLASQA